MIYVLLLKENKFYVGYTGRPIGERFIEHFDYKGSKWTTLYRPLQVLQVQPGGIKEENEMTLVMMEKYGWWNVRGGSWAKVEMHSCPQALLERQRLKLPPPLQQIQPIPRKSDRNVNDGCFKCGRNSHFASDCFARTTNSGRLLESSDSDQPKQKKSDRNVNNGCFKCGRNSHFASDCFARTTNSGRLLESPDSDQPKRKKSDRNVNDGCFKCGRNSHFASDCFARTTNSGRLLESPDSDQPKRKKSDRNVNDGCFKCGRNSHFASDCFARTTYYSQC